MSTKLIKQKGSYQEDEILLEPDRPYTIGRHPDVDITIPDDLISRQHCRIFFQDGYFVVEDLNSKNGTYVNGSKITFAPLFSDDRIAMGNAEFCFQMHPEKGMPSAPVLRDAPTDQFSTEFKERVPQRAATQFSVERQGGRERKGIEEVERELSAVCRIIDVVNREESLDKLFDRIMDHVMDVTDADRGYLFSGKEVGGAITPQVVKHGKELSSSYENTFSRSMVMECYQTGYAILRADPLGTGTQPTHSIISQAIQSLLCVPMCCEEGTVGVIYVDKLTGGRKFSKKDLRILSAIANEAGIAVRRAQLTDQVETLFSEAIRALIRIIEAKDQYTSTHSERVTEIAVLFGEKLEMEKSRLRDLRLAGLLHDVGKVAAPVELLTKPASLTDSEYSEVRMHATYSAQIVEGIENAAIIADVVRYHHERWDGKGYPEGLKGEDIPELSRILSIADAFDSMFGGRAYKSALAMDEAIEELQMNSGTQFAPEPAAVFIRALREDETFRRQIFSLYKDDVVESTHEEAREDSEDFVASYTLS